MATRRDVAAAGEELARAAERLLRQADAASYALSGEQRRAVNTAQQAGKRIAEDARPKRRGWRT